MLGARARLAPLTVSYDASRGCSSSRCRAGGIERLTAAEVGGLARGCCRGRACSRPRIWSPACDDLHLHLWRADRLAVGVAVAGVGGLRIGLPRGRAAGGVRALARHCDQRRTVGQRVRDVVAGAARFAPGDDRDAARGSRLAAWSAGGSREARPSRHFVPVDVGQALVRLCSVAARAARACFSMPRRRTAHPPGVGGIVCGALVSGSGSPSSARQPAHRGDRGARQGTTWRKKIAQVPPPGSSSNRALSPGRQPVQTAHDAVAGG